MIGSDGSGSKDGKPALPFEAELADARVLVTGHTGFTGAWLCLWLLQLGAKAVVGLALAPHTDPSLFEAAGIAKGIDSVFGDIRDKAVVHDLVDTVRPRVIFHLAAQPLVSHGFEDPVATFATNVLGTAHVLEAARQVPGVEAVVCVTTDKVYADQGWSWGYREVDGLGGKDPYSASKACAELVAAAYRSTLASRGNRVRIATARGGNIVGGGDWSDDRLVPDFVRALTSGGSLRLRNPQAIRPWQHVLALVHAYLVLADRLLSSAPPAEIAWNFGPVGAEARSVADLVQAMGRSWRNVSLDQVPAAFPETNFLHLDSTRARSVLGWRPPLDFDATVALTIDWYRRYYDKPKAARGITIEQIEDYRRVLAETVR